LEHEYLFFGDERADAVMQAKDLPCGISPSANPLWGIPQGKDKGGRSTTEEMPYSLNLAIYT